MHCMMKIRSSSQRPTGNAYRKFESHEISLLVTCLASRRKFIESLTFSSKCDIINWWHKSSKIQIFNWGNKSIRSTCSNSTELTPDLFSCIEWVVFVISEYHQSQIYRAKSTSENYLKYRIIMIEYLIVSIIPEYFNCLQHNSRSNTLGGRKILHQSYQWFINRIYINWIQGKRFVSRFKYSKK